MGKPTRWLRELRTAMWKLDCHCTYCGMKTILPPAPLNGKSDDEATLDHLLPRAYGGKNNEGNLVLCCRGCNNTRATKRLLHFLQQDKGYLCAGGFGGKNLDLWERLAHTLPPVLVSAPTLTMPNRKRYHKRSRKQNAWNEIVRRAKTKWYT